MNQDLYEKLAGATEYLSLLDKFIVKIAVKEKEPDGIKSRFYQQRENGKSPLALVILAWIALIGSGLFLAVGLILSPNFHKDMSNNVTISEFTNIMISIMAVPAIIFIVSLITIIVANIHDKSNRKKFDKIYEDTIVPQMEQSKKELDELAEKFREFIAQNSHLVDFLSEQYQDIQATSFMMLAVSSGRADTLKEAMNLYEEQLHRWKLEDAARESAESQEYLNRAMIELQTETNERLRQIEFTQYLQYLHDKSDK